MDVFGVYVPYKALTNIELYDFANKLQIPLRGVFMRDSLPNSPYENENGIVNFNKSSESGTHWVCYYKKGDCKIYFDSYGGVVLQEVRNYLKSPIYRNTDIVQGNTPFCGHLCLYVLKSLNNGNTFRDTLNSLETVGTGIKWTTPLAEELHRPIRKHFTKRYVFVRNVDDIFGADLIDMQALSKQNKGYKYILMVEDIFSKYGWAVPLKTKTGIAVRDALKQIFKQHVPKKLWTDAGWEFYNTEVKTLLKKHDITLYSTENEEKCSVVERWNRTIKTKLWKYFTANHTHKYIDVLDALIEKYNNTVNRAIGMTPTEARKPSNHGAVFRHLYFKKMAKLGEKKPKFQIGDKVRLGVKKDLFEKSYIINWSDKIYTIKRVFATRPITYKVEDDKGVEHKGKFYEQDLQKTKVDEFRIQKVLKKTKNSALVRWVDYDSSYDSWIPLKK